VAVDDDGHLIGGVRADDVIKLLDEQRRVPEVG
jgi:osmoprotectant transport system ATP-binding protein